MDRSTHYSCPLPLILSTAADAALCLWSRKPFPRGSSSPVQCHKEEPAPTPAPEKTGSSLSALAALVESAGSDVWPATAFTPAFNTSVERHLERNIDSHGMWPLCLRWFRRVCSWVLKTMWQTLNNSIKLLKFDGHAVWFVLKSMIPNPLLRWTWSHMSACPVVGNDQTLAR